MIFIPIIHQHYPKTSIYKLHALCKRCFSACSVCILPSRNQRGTSQLVTRSTCHTEKSCDEL